MTDGHRPTNSDIYIQVNELRKELVERDEELEKKIDATYLRVKQYEADIYPIKRFVYGLIAITGGALVTAVIGLVIATQ